MASARRWLSRIANRLIGPIVPASCEVPFRYRLNRIAGCEPELKWLHRVGPNHGVAIDAGANEGLFSYRLAGLYDKVHAFEILPDLAAKLQAWRSKRVEVHAIGLSDRAGEGTLYVPIKAGRPLYGWASLDAKNCPDADSLVEKAVSFRPLDSFDLGSVSFVKADVEGHELALLAGAKQTIQRHRPVVLLEVKDANQSAVRSYFADLGYFESRLDQLIGVAGSPENFIFLPTAPTSR